MIVKPMGSDSKKRKCDCSCRHYTEKKELLLAKVWIYATRRRMMTKDKIGVRVQTICMEICNMDRMANSLMSKWTTLHCDCYMDCV